MAKNDVLYLLNYKSSLSVYLADHWIYITPNYNGASSQCLMHMVKQRFLVLLRGNPPGCHKIVFKDSLWTHWIQEASWVVWQQQGRNK